jgi:ABC-2 type transport system permease protein
VTTAVIGMQGPVAAGTRLRHGPRHWLRSYLLMLRFDWGRSRQYAPLMIIVQLLMGAGMAVMYGFFYPEISETTALYITTGVPTLALVPLGLLMVPGAVGDMRMEGTFDVVWSLPTPRSAQAGATFTLFTLLALPGTVLALVVAAWRYDVSLDLSPVLVPAVLLSAVMAVVVGFGMALAIENPMVTNLITNALMFVVLLFSPIVYPASNLPDWLAAAHQVLPFESMATAIRAGLTDGLVTGTGTAFVVLGLWTSFGCALTAWVVGRRR